MILASIAFILIISYITYSFYKKRKTAKYLMEKFNVPPTFRFYGHLSYFPKDLSGKFEKICELVREYGKNFVMLGPFYTVNLVISDPKDAEVFLSNSNTKSAKKSIEYDFLKPWLGTGLLISDGDKWFQRRKIITPSFHFNILEAFVGVMNQQSDIFIKKLETIVAKEEFDISNYISLLTLDIICEASMGIKIDAQFQPDSDYVRAVQKITNLIYQRIFSIKNRVPGMYMLSRDGWKHRNLVNRLHKFTTKTITNRREKIAADSTYQIMNKMNFLDMLLHVNIDGKPMADADIREEVDTFMFEGHDTVSSSLTFAFYQLSKHPNIQEKVYQEVSEIYENNPNSVMTYQKLGEMKYLEMVIKEVLRTMPSVPFIGRKVTEDVEIASANITVPAGTDIVIAVYSMHHDPENFPNPEKFDPERFNTNSIQTRHPFAYIPFSAGSRNCIGQRFAMLEMKTAISKTVINYRLLPGSGNTVKSGKDILLQAALILKPCDGVRLRLEKRL